MPIRAASVTEKVAQPTHCRVRLGNRPLLIGAIADKLTTSPEDPPMPRSRPAALTVVAVLAIIYGSLATVCNLCGVVRLASAGAMNQGFMGGGNPEQAKMQKELQEAIERDVPAARVIEIAVTAVDLLLGIAMLVAGIGLLGPRPWARLLALLTALAAVLISILQLVFNVVFVIPATNRAITDVLPRAAPQGAPPAVLQAMQLTMSIFMYGILAVVVLVIIYLLIMILLLLRRDVKAALAEAASPDQAIASGYPGGESADEGWAAAAPPPNPEDEHGIEPHR